MVTNKNLFYQLIENLSNKNLPFLKTALGISFSYRDMINISGQYANALVGLGIKKNDRIIVQSEKQIECIWLYLACLRIGAIYITINPAYTVSETVFFLQDAKPKLFVTNNIKENKALNTILLDNDVSTIIDTKDKDKNSFTAVTKLAKTKFETCFSQGEETAAILYTSGTTGQSKGALLSHSNLFSNAKALSEVWEFSSKDILLHILPIYHTHGLFVAFNTVIASNSSILFLEKFNAAEVINTLSKISVMMGVPTHYIRLLNEKNFVKSVVKDIRLFISGSAPLSPQIHQRFKKITGLSILERYGMTETNMITSNPYRNKRKPGTVGLPLPNVMVRVTNIANGGQVTDGIVGGIEVKGPNVFKGYWQMPEKIKTDFCTDGYFKTGDLGYIDADGYLNISGRSKDLIISGGLNVYPAEVEKIVDTLEGVAESTIIGLPHDDFGEGVTAVVVFKNDFHFDEAALRKLIGNKLASFKVPMRIIIRESLPKNAMGKIQKNLLRQEYNNLYIKNQ